MVENDQIGFPRTDSAIISAVKEDAGPQKLPSTRKIAKEHSGVFPRFPGVYCFLFLLVSIFSSQAAPTRQVLPGHVPAAVAHLTAVARLPASQKLHLAIGLPLRNREALSSLLHQIYDPASPSYRHYLTGAQFSEQFSPSEQDYLAIIEFAKTNGLSITGLPANRMMVNVDASVADIERVLHVTMRSYPHPSEARTFYAPDMDPSLDLQTPITDICGLSDFGKPRPNYIVRHKGNSSMAAPNSGSGSGGTYIGNDFRAAYLPGVSLNGAGQTVALVQFDGYLVSDITAYENQAGIHAVTLTNVLLDGFSGTPTGNGGEVEVSMDIELAIAMAPGLSKVIVYEGNPNNFIPNDVLNRIALDNSARQISCSWTWTGGPSVTTDQIFQQMAAQGQSFFTASGDVDSYKNGAVDNASLFGYPAQSPYVTSVGGTTLTTTGPGGSYTSETVWNTRTWDSSRSAYVGSSGGISTYYAIPSWQQGVSMASNGGSTVSRNFPDVALTADNVLAIADNGVTYSVGGTSCAAPLWAGFMALVNQQATNAGIASVGFLNPTIYSISKGSHYAADLHDTTTGDNTSPNLQNTNGSTNQFYAVAGYDLCTGWGSPAGSNLINDLTVIPPPKYRLYGFPLNSDPGWTRQGQWTFGQPQGLGGGANRGSPDPTSGATGTNVFGVNLSGDYSTTIGGPYYLTTGPLNFGGCSGINLQFQRWLNSDRQSRVTDTVEISTNGTSWTQVFINGSSAITQTAWSNCQYDISAVADNQTNVYARWGYRIVSSLAKAYSGWNIDDITFSGSPTLSSSNSIGSIAPLGTSLSWLLEYGLTNDAFNIEELMDTDGDGVPNWQEYIADTDPTNRNSYFHIVAVSGSPSWEVFFVSSPARLYSLEYSTNLVFSNAWSGVGGQSGITGAAGTTMLDDTNRSGALFYRVRAQVPP